MASTRNKNTPGNYCLDQRQNVGIEDWQLYAHGANGKAFDTKLAGNGLIQGQMPANQLSHNAPDIESFLFGINSTNLVSPASSCFTPQLTNHDSANLVMKKPTLMPIPLTVPKNQRPFSHF